MEKLNEVIQNLEKNNSNLVLNNNQKIDTLSDGVEILRDKLDDDEDKPTEISDSDLRKLVEFSTGMKNITDEELLSLRNDDNELQRLIRVSIVKSKSFKYSPKKNFGVAYRKKRKQKNKQTKKSRINNRK